MSDTNSSLVIGVDGGGTGCRAAVGTVSRGVLGRGEAGRANATSDRNLAIQNILNAVGAATRQASYSENALASATAHVGVAGVLTAQDSNHIASALPFRDITVTDDRVTTVVGALGDTSGALLSIGTGTIIALQTASNVAFSGGWGLQVSDQGSGAWLGRMALERVLLCYDGLFDHTPLTDALLRGFRRDPRAISSFAASASPSDFGNFARDVIAAANGGDAFGRDLLQKGAHHLARSLDILGFQSGGRLCLAGGVGPHYKRYLSDKYTDGYAVANGSALDGAFALACARVARLEGTS